MSHWILLPVLLPMLTALTLLIGARLGMHFSRVVSLLGAVALLGVELQLLNIAQGDTITLYALGNWPPPFGIVLVLDRLAALMLAMTGVLAVFCLGYAACNRDKPGDSLHPLVHFLLMGLNGAFLTGDLFNLFVFFEVLLLASYALLLHGGGARRAKAGIHYVVLNLAGSALFLVAIALLYGVTGTLNMVDMGQRIVELDPADRPLAHTGGYLLFVVFALKAAVVPLYFWLPSAYSSATGPVAALFAVMTKLGIYTILRVYSLVFGMDGEGFADFLTPWLWPLALITLALGCVGTLAAGELRRQVAYLVVVSVGTLLVGIAMNTSQSLSASLYYLLHSTWICAALFLLAELIGLQRGPNADKITGGAPLAQGTTLGVLFFIGAVTVVGLPPTSGFVGKLTLMQAAVSPAEVMWVWPALLLSSLLSITALSRSGSTFFWRTSGDPIEGSRASAISICMVSGLAAASLALSFGGHWVLAYTDATAQQLLNPELYVQALSNFEPVREGAE